MRVGELKKLLEEVPDDMEIVVDSYDSGEFSTPDSNEIGVREFHVVKTGKIYGFHYSEFPAQWLKCQCDSCSDFPDTEIVKLFFLGGY